MKLILSRKGFDSSSGGCPSPLFPDGSALSLPIPDPQSPLRYGDLQGCVARMVADLTRGRLGSGDPVHLDPDLVRSAVPRHRGWRPVLGQAGAAQGHLAAQGVAAGDLFLFFGLFRPVEQRGGRWRFVPGSRSRHRIWGWLQVGEVWRVAGLSAGERRWCGYHPHCHGERAANNTLYLAARRLTLPAPASGLPGAGLLTGGNPEFVLTAPEATSPSLWRLPAAFMPTGGRPPLTYHQRSDRWRRVGEECRLQSAARGQEFVLDTVDYPGVQTWLWELLSGDAGAPGSS